MKLKLFILTLISFCLFPLAMLRRKSIQKMNFYLFLMANPKRELRNIWVNLTVKRLRSNRKMPALWLAGQPTTKTTKRKIRSICGTTPILWNQVKTPPGRELNSRLLMTAVWTSPFLINPLFALAKALLFAGLFFCATLNHMI